MAGEGEGTARLYLKNDLIGFVDFEALSVVCKKRKRKYFEKHEPGEESPESIDLCVTVS